MSDSVNKQIVPYIERARKVLQYEQRGNHQDQIVRGGLEVFVVRWADEAIAACKNAGLDPKPIHRFTEYLEGYRRQDPIQRAANLRAALAILNELETDGQSNKASNSFRSQIPTQADNTVDRVSPDTIDSPSFRGDLDKERWGAPPPPRSGDIAPKQPISTEK